MSNIGNQPNQQPPNVSAIRRALLAGGFTPTPCAGKRPVLDAWQTSNPTAADIAHWAKKYAHAGNTGILTAHCPAIDIDTRDKRAADMIGLRAMEILGRKCAVRFGERPKAALFCRTDTPFPKVSTPAFQNPADPTLPNGKPKVHRVEILGDGQQAVIDGIHPDTKGRYTWSGGALTTRAELAEITPAMVEAIIAMACEVFRSLGFVEVKPSISATSAEIISGNVTNREMLYAAAALEGEARALAVMAPNSGRNNTLNIAALKMGKMTARGWIDRGIVEAKLVKACEHNKLIADDGPRTVRKTIRSGLMAGEKEPHADLPERLDKATAAPSRPKPRLVSSKPEPEPELAEDVKLEDFFAIMPSHTYLAPTREPWVAASINARIEPIMVGDKPMSAAAWLDRSRPVETITWHPAFPMLIKDKLASNGGFISHLKVTCLNLYRPPEVKLGDAGKAGPWIEHIKKVYPDDWPHILKWLAQRVQQPGEKCNHALVLGGDPGIGKDMMLEPIPHAVGPWNFCEVSPRQMLGRFNGYIKSVVLRISEARDLGDVDRFAFYDATKTIIAAPPDVLRCDEKNLREHPIFNVTGVIITTNRKTDGIHLEENDRRHYVAWSDLTKDDFDDGYWRKLKPWYRSGGIEHVAAYLATMVISDFDPKEPPPKTAAFFEIVMANAAPEDAELADILDRLNMDAVTISKVAQEARDSDIALWLRDRKNSRAVGHRLDACGFVAVRNEAAKDGQWIVAGKRQRIYARKSLSYRDKVIAARHLAGR
jgi:hypothetical protein